MAVGVGSGPGGNVGAVDRLSPAISEASAVKEVVRVLVLVWPTDLDGDAPHDCMRPVVVFKNCEQ